MVKTALIFIKSSKGGFMYNYELYLYVFGSQSFKMPMNYGTFDK